MTGSWSIPILFELMRLLKSFRKRQEPTVGYIEHVADGIVRGWAWNASSSNEHLCLDVFVRGVFAGCARTGQFRRDLLDNGIGEGTHAFVFHIPRLLQSPEIAKDEVEVFANAQRVSRLGKVTRGALTPPRKEASAALSPQFYFRTLIDAIASLPTSINQGEMSRRRQVDRLVASAPEGMRSTFAAHIAAKYGKALAPPPDARFWRWFLTDYAVEKGSARTPLSAADIDAMATLRRDGTQTFLPSDSGRLIDRYLWAIDASRRLFLEDCLVSSQEADALRQVPVFGRRIAFPLSRFMILFRRRHPLLRGQRLLTRQDRIKIYALIMQFALWDVHYLAYLPARWLQSMLEGAAGQSPFERAQRALLGIEHVLAPRAFLGHVQNMGFDVSSQSFSGTRYGANRVLGGTKVVDRTRPVDVQLIGPFQRSLGLAESCRRIATALRRTGLPSNFVDYDIGTASGRTASDIPLGPIRAARVNILHVNAEEAPEVIAYLPDCFSHSHTIIVPYWELNRPARVHELGLTLADEIWATTCYLADGFAQSGRRVTHIGMSADERPEISREEGRRALADHGLPADGFVFLTTFDALSWVQRKNPLGVVDAFRAAFGSAGPALVIKTRNAGTALSRSQRETWNTIRSRCESDSRILILDADLSPRDHKAIVAGCDCLVSLHRAEGLGLDLLDAAAQGTPIVATAYSGNMDYCNADCAWLVDYTLVPVPAEDYAFVEPGHVWAEPSFASAVSALRGVLHDEGRRIARAETGCNRIRDWWSADAFAARLGGLICARLASLER